MTERVLVAGVGNIFLGDDGFGVAVASRMAGETFPEGVKVGDFGIRSVHLAYELLDGYDSLVLIDALSRGDRPGTLTVLEPELDDHPLGEAAGLGAMDAHTMHPEAVLNMLSALGGHLRRVVVVGCEPALVEEYLGLRHRLPAQSTRPWRSCGISSRSCPPLTGRRDHRDPTIRLVIAVRRHCLNGGAVLAGHRPVSEDQGDVTTVVGDVKDGRAIGAL